MPVSWRIVLIALLCLIALIDARRMTLTLAEIAALKMQLVELQRQTAAIERIHVH